MEKFIEFLLYLQGPVPYLVAFVVLLFCGFGVPIPEDITLFAMGILSYYGLVDLKVSIVVCFAGVILGDSLVFLLGKTFGEKLAQKGVFAKFFHPERMDRTKQLFAKWGNKVMFAARFMPGLRTPLFFSAGTFKLSFWVFFFYDGLAALLSVPLLVGGSYLLGDKIDSFIKYARKVEHAIAFIIVGVVILLLIKAWIKKRRLRSG